MQYFLLGAFLWTLLIFMFFRGTWHEHLNMTGIASTGTIPHTIRWWATPAAAWLLGLLCLGVSLRYIFKLKREITIITEQHALREQEITHQKMLLEAMVNSITDGVVLVDAEDRIIMVNPAFIERFGYSLDEVSGRTTEFLYADSMAYYEQRGIRYNRNSEIVQSVYEMEYRLKDGTIIPSETMGAHVLGQGNEITGYLIVIRDITERKQVEQDAAIFRERSLGAEIAAHAGSCIWDVTSDTISWSENLYRIHGLSPGSFDGTIDTVMSFVHPDDFDAVQHMIHKLFLDKRPQEIAYRIVTPAGIEKDVLCTTRLIVDENGKVHKIIAMIQDVTSQKMAEKENELNCERLKFLLKLHEMVDSSISEIIESGLEGCVRISDSKVGYVYCPDQEQVDNGFFTWSGEVLRDCTAFPGEKGSLANAGIWADSLRTEQPAIHNDYKNESTRKGVPDGHIHLVRHMSIPIFNEERIVAIVGVGNKEKPYDETDIKQVTLLAEGMNKIVQRKNELEKQEDFELQLQHAYKIEALNTLADGIAHDFSNILGIIFINADVALEDIPAGNPARINLKRIIQASARAKDLVKQIIAYSCQAEQKLIVLEPSKLVEESLTLLKSALPESVEIMEDMCTDCGNIEADPNQLQQLFMNLFSHAVHDMDPAGTLKVKTAVVELQAADFEGREDTQPGSYFRLSVAYSGMGIDKKTQDRLFDLPFIDKKQGDGTSLGLSVAKGIVRGHRGIFRVEGQPEDGNAFHVFFPLLDSETTLSDQITGDNFQGTERILFVDDEVLLAEMTGEMLKRKGYQVNVQADSINALEIFRSNPKGFDLVISDQSMTKMTGTELAVEILNIRPDIPVVLLSGYSKKISVEKVLDLGIKDFLYKPFEMSTLLRVIRRVLKTG